MLKLFSIHPLCRSFLMLKFIAVNLSFSHRLLPFSTNVSIYPYFNTISLNTHHVYTVRSHHTKSISSKSYFNFAHLTTIHLLLGDFRFLPLFFIKFSTPPIFLSHCYQKLEDVIWASYYFCAAFDRHQIPKSGKI